MNVGTLFKAFDTMMAFRDAAKRFKTGAPPEAPPAEATAYPGTSMQNSANQVEARLTGVVVAALKEAFNRDHARLELERAQLDEERRRAEEALRLEVRRQMVDREIARLRWIAATAMAGWIASMIVVMFRVAAMSVAQRAVTGVGWVLMLGALGGAIAAQGQLGLLVADRDKTPDGGAAGAAALWLLIAGLACAAGAMLL